jgi:hypothetical protein
MVFMKSFFYAAFFLLSGVALCSAQEESKSVFSGKMASFKEAHAVFEVSCLPCHSTAKPLAWHEKLPVMSALKKSEYRKALAGINFDETVYLAGAAPAPEVLDRIEQVILNGKMPPHDYIIRNWKARLSKKEKQAVLDWIQDERRLYQPAEAVVVENTLPPTPDLKPLKVLENSFQPDDLSDEAEPVSEVENSSNPFKPRKF